MTGPFSPPRLSAGVITADLTRLGDELDHLRGKAAWAHVDVMDCAFCPQLTVGPAFVAAVASTGIPVDAHLLVEEPRRLLPEIAAAGAAEITVHAEATRHLHRTMAEMTELSRQGRPFIRGVAINPGTAANTRQRVAGVRELARQAGAEILVGVDGGVTIGNAAEMAGWDVDVLVSGSASFDRVDPAKNLDRLNHELLHPVRQAAGRSPQEASDGKR
jgi:ribulose-phosphate 3-epimerase